MLLFAHTGITLGSAWLSSSLARKGSQHSEKASGKEKTHPYSHPLSLNRALSWSRRLDYRLILIGSMLPDIVDKPIGLFLPTFSGGRGFAHSLFFTIIVSAFSLYLYKRHQSFAGTSLAFGSFIHLLLDEMWLYPHILFWPGFGWAFTGFGMSSPGNFLKEMLLRLLTDPFILTSEIIGAIVLIAFLLNLLRKGKFGAFLKEGMVS